MMTMVWKIAFFVEMQGKKATGRKMVPFL